MSWQLQAVKNNTSWRIGNEKFTIKNIGYTMVLILDVCSFYYAHVWSKSDISIWHLVTSKGSSNPICFTRKRPISNNSCATCSELPSYISTMTKPVSYPLQLRKIKTVLLQREEIWYQLWKQCRVKIWWSKKH